MVERGPDRFDRLRAAMRLTQGEIYSFEKNKNKSVNYKLSISLV